MGLALVAQERAVRSRRRRYTPPAVVHRTTLSEALAAYDRPPLQDRQASFIAQGQSASDTFLHYAGNLDLLACRSVAIVGAREVSDDGAARARRLARAAADADMVVVSGLAKGVDINAHRACIAAGGKTIAVIGTPLSKAYPADHAEIQEQIARDHLLISPFKEGTQVFPSNFPKRNRVMAALTDGTVIVEASDSSGTLHQAAECQRLGRWLFIVKSVYEDPGLTWPKKFSRYDKLCVVTKPEDIFGVLPV